MIVEKGFKFFLGGQGYILESEQGNECIELFL